MTLIYKKFLPKIGIFNCRYLGIIVDVRHGMGILTTDTLEQAIKRAGTKAGNK